MSDYHVIGKGVPQIGSWDKVTGQARYIEDITLPGMLHGRTLGSPYPHARIIRIDTRKAEKLPGVKAIVTREDYSGKLYGELRSTRDRHFIAIDKVRFIGDELAGVAAVSEEVAEEALGLIEVEYEELPAVFDAEEAMREGAPQLHERAPGNIALAQHWHFGDVEKGFQEADYVREDRFTSQVVTHGYLEPSGCLASFEQGRLAVWTSHQRPYMVQRALAYLLDLPYSRVRVLVPATGGAFGGKTSFLPLHLLASVLSRKSGRPVRIIQSKEEQFAVTARRIPMSIHVKTGVKKDGTLVSQAVRMVSNGGAYIDIGAITIYNTGFGFLLPYRLPNFSYDAYRVYTNTPMAGSQRGHGQPQSRFAAECQLDMICEDLGLDAIEVRRRNSVRPGEETVNGLKIVTCGFNEALDTVVERSGWREKKGRVRGKGVGIGGGGFVCGALLAAQTDSSAIIKLNEDGTAVLSSGAVDVGQGFATVGAMIVAEALGLTVQDVHVVPIDTDTTPYDPGTVSSRVTFYAGNAVKLAAEDVRRKLARVAAGKLGCSPESVKFADRAVYSTEAPGEKRMSFTDLVRLAQTSTPNSGTILGQGTFFPSNAHWPNPRQSYAGNVSPSYSFSAQVAEVEVDEETGQVKLVKMTMADDAGYPLNPLSVAGQAHGSASMGHGQILMEEVVMNEGRILNPSFLDYKMPTALDSPALEVFDIITDDPGGPFGAKEVGEGFIVSTLPAIVNAVHDATGVWIKDLPVTPEKILAGMKLKEDSSKDPSTARGDG